LHIDQITNTNLNCHYRVLQRVIICAAATSPGNHIAESSFVN